MFFESWKVGGSCCPNFLSICLFIFYKIKIQFKICVYNESCLSNLFEQLIFVLLLFLSRRTFWYWQIWFDGDGRNSTATVRFTPTAQSPSREAVLICSTCRQTKLPSSDTEYWTLYLKTDGPSGLLQDYLLCDVNVYSRPTSRNDKRGWKYKLSKDNQKRLPKILCIPETKREKWIKIVL